MASDTSSHLLVHSRRVDGAAVLMLPLGPDLCSAAEADLNSVLLPDGTPRSVCRCRQPHRRCFLHSTWVLPSYDLLSRLQLGGGPLPGRLHYRAYVVLDALRDRYGIDFQAAFGRALRPPAAHYSRFLLYVVAPKEMATARSNWLLLQQVWVDGLKRAGFTDSDTAVRLKDDLFSLHGAVVASLLGAFGAYGLYELLASGSSPLALCVNAILSVAALLVVHQAREVIAEEAMDFRRSILEQVYQRTGPPVPLAASAGRTASAAAQLQPASLPVQPAPA